MGQDYDKDLYIVLVGSGTTTHKNFVDNVEDYIFGPKDEREATLLVPFTRDLTPTMGRILWDWAIGDDEEPNYPIHAYVEPEAGHKAISKATTTAPCEEHGTTMTSGALEAAMTDLVSLQKNGNEVVVVVIYDEENDVKLVGELKNYQSIPVLNADGMIDSFPGFKTTDEILREEREREEFETKEAIRIAAEKEQEKAVKKAAASPRKRAAAKPVEDKPLTEKTPAKKAAAPRKRVAKSAEPLENHPGGLDEFKAPKEETPEYKVGDVVEVGGIPFVKHSELPSELEPVKELPKPVETVPDLWRDVSQAKAEVDKGEVTHYAVSKENLASLSEGITEMAQSFSKVMSAMTKIIEGE